MIARALVLAAALTLAACSPRQETPTQNAPDVSGLDAPAPGAAPTRAYTPVNEAASDGIGPISVEVATSLGGGEAGEQETLSIRGGGGFVLQAAVTSAVSPATQVQGQTLRALMALPVEEPQTLVYRVSSQTKSGAGRGLCGADDPAFIVVWEPAGPGDGFKLMGLTGGAPGAAAARACAMLEYRRG